MNAAKALIFNPIFGNRMGETITRDTKTTKGQPSTLSATMTRKWQQQEKRNGKPKNHTPIITSFWLTQALMRWRS